MEENIANAITSGMLGPATGGALVLVSWIAAKLKDGIPLKDQLRTALPTLRAAVAAAAGTTGLSLMGGMATMPAIATGLAVLLAMLNLRAPKAQ